MTNYTLTFVISCCGGSKSLVTVSFGVQLLSASLWLLFLECPPKVLSSCVITNAVFLSFKILSPLNCVPEDMLPSPLSLFGVTVYFKEDVER